MALVPKNIPHIQQPKNSNWCGAACLKMIYEFYAIEHPDLEQIWDFVKGISWGTGNINCRTYLMAQHARKNGFNSMVISCEDSRSVIEICQKNNIEVIALCRANPSAIIGHFIVITGINYKGIFVNDPLLPVEKGKNKLYKVSELLPLLHPLYQTGGTVAQDMTTSCTFLLMAPPTIPTTTIVASCPNGCRVEEQAFSAILPLNPKILCLAHDSWFSSFHEKE